MRILIFSADYPRFLRDLYLSQPGLAEQVYAVQMAARNASLFGCADFYSRNFRAHGHEAAEIHVNNPWMQYAWARENGLKVAPLMAPPREGDPPPPPLSLFEQAVAAAKMVARPVRPTLKPLWRLLRRRLRRFQPPPTFAPTAPDRSEWERMILKAQIEKFQPDLILNQELAYLHSSFIKQLRKPGRLIFGQIASSLPDDDPFEGYDMMISSLPNQVVWFRKRGLRAEINRLAFEPSVLDTLGPPPARDIPLSFIGSLSPDHKSRIEFLEYLATRTPLQVWGNGIERIPAESPLHAVYQGEAWGAQMYQIMRRSRITLNFHIDLAENWANNLRLYEATGVGALLLTDWKSNLYELFTVGEHLVAYRDAEDCVRQINLLLEDHALREKIAQAGQRHTLSVHNYYSCTGEIAALAEKVRRFGNDPGQGQL